MSRRRRQHAVALALSAVLAVVLTACNRPLPTITVYGDGRSVVVDANAYQLPGGALRTQHQDYADAPTISVAAGSELLVDVPRRVATQTWLVAAFTLGADGKTAPLAGAGSAGALTDQHTTRVSTAPAGVGEYYLQVVELRGTTQSGGWTLRVRTRG
ncbi:MAG: hypothetical protein ABJA87_04145 [bacterium]